MGVIGIDHVQLAIPAGGESIACQFYGTVLGLTEIPKPSNLAKRGGCWFQGDSVTIHLGVEAEFRPQRKAHPGLLVSSLTGLCATLETAGFPVVTDEPLQGYVRVYTEDPFGNRIELMERTSQNQA